MRGTVKRAKHFHDHTQIKRSKIKQRDRGSDICNYLLAWLLAKASNVST